MKLKVEYKFNESYVPPRCRKPRTREVIKTMSVTIREITSSEAPIALVVTDYDYRNKDFVVCDTEYRLFKNNLYKLYRHQSGNNSGDLHTHEDVMRDLKRNGYGYPYDADEARRKADIRKAAKCFLIIDGDIYAKAGEPRYVIHTFGLGHNHGGSSFSITDYYNGNISKNRYFNAMQRDDAVKAFERIALGRGDDKSVHPEYVDNIKVLIPEAVKCNPQKQHGNGCSFINSLESMVRGSNSRIEAGLGVMAIGLAGIAQ